MAHRGNSNSRRAHGRVGCGRRFSVSLTSRVPRALAGRLTSDHIAAMTGKSEHAAIDKYALLIVCIHLQMRVSASAKIKTRQQLSTFKAEFFKALAHPLRISILDALHDGELTVNEISQRFAVEPANASQQLAVLRNKNIVAARKEGANVYYSVSDKAILVLLDVARDIFNNHLVGVRSMLEEMESQAPVKRARR